MNISRAKIVLVCINIFCGGAVLASYALCLAANPGSGNALWGGVPASFRSAYTASMLAAAAGYLAFTHYVLLRIDSGVTLFGGRCTYRFFNILYVVILVPSAFWMPLTFEMIRSPSRVLWVLICVVLAAVGAGSIAMLAAIISSRAPASPLSRAIAILGSAAFSLQTAILDAVLWTANFR